MRLGLDPLWLFLAVALPALAALIVPLPAVDLAYQVRTGDMILATGRIPSVDTFTFTVAGTPWVDQQWLAQVKLAAGFGLGGWELLAVLRAALVAFTFGAAAATALVQGASRRTAAILALLAFVISAPALALRPQLFGIALFAGLLWIVAVRDRHPRLLILAPVMVAVWANVHGSFFLGPMLLGYAWLDDLARGRPARPALLALVTGTAATLVNPFGPGVWAYTAGIGADPEITAQVSEWQHTSPLTAPGLLFYVSVVAAAAVAWLRRGRLRWPDWLWLVTLFAIGAWTERGLAWWPLGAVPVVALALATGGAPATAARRENRLNTAVVGVLAAAVVLALPWWRPIDPLTGRAGLLTYAPSDLAQALRARIQPGTRVFTPQVWASWFEWSVPDGRYFLDSRFELFPPEIWEGYDVIAAGGPGATAALEDWDVEVLVLPAGADAPGGGWTRAFEGSDGSILVSARPVD
jgi:hypothetical protein